MSHASRLPVASRVRIRGVSLVESLVALVVLSVGMLGIASLYVASLQAGRTALTRTIAVDLVNDMIDRIRANPLGRGEYDLGSHGGTPATHDCVAAEDDTNCSYQELAEDDLATWLAAAREALPGLVEADVQVEEVGGKKKPDRYLVLIKWNEAGNPQTLSYQGNLSMIPVIP